MEKDTATIRLLLTRHGETQQNHKGIICGQQPGTLTTQGTTQAQKIGVCLDKSKATFDHIYVSDLGRTVATFTNIKNKAPVLQKIPTTFTKLLRQRSGGVLQGKPLAMWKQQADKAGKDIREYKCAKAQNWIDVNKRCELFLQLIVETHIIQKKLQKNTPVSLFGVCHGGVLMEFHNMRKKLMQKQEPKFTNSAKNCSFHEFEIQYPLGLKEFKLENVVIKCIRQNDVDHLQ